jgi:hypothetical protein
MTPKSTTPKLNRFQITADGLPSAIFFSLGDLRDSRLDALTERRAIKEYRIDGVEDSLFETLHGLGWEYADIAAVACGAQMATSYRMPNRASSALSSAMFESSISVGPRAFGIA